MVPTTSADSTWRWKKSESMLRGWPIVLGSATALTSLGLILIWRANRFINFAQMALGGAVGLTAAHLFLTWHWPYPVALALGVIGGVGLLSYKEDYSTTTFFKKPTQAVEGFKVLERSFPAGTLAPSTMLVQRDNGLYTYFASDIAYHLNKVERGFDRVIDVWGADHHGYIPRVRGAMQALDLDAAVLDVTLIQFVSLLRNGEKASMSTRAGEYVTLRQVREEVGNDACRFFYMLRKQDQALDFDLELAKSQSTDNPVYYVQYAHARICSMLAQWGGDTAALADAGLVPLSGERELALCARLREFPETVRYSAREYAPHSIAFYLKDLAADFHGWYNAERVLVDDDAVRSARLALALAVRQTLVNGLRLLGVSAPESM